MMIVFRDLDFLFVISIIPKKMMDRKQTNKQADELQFVHLFDYADYLDSVYQFSLGFLVGVFKVFELPALI